jgi:hypothetical protein
VELGRPRTSEPMGLGMSHLPEDDDRRSHSQGPPSAIDELLQHLTTLSNQLESAVELWSSVQAQHATAQNTISALESKVVSLETRQISGGSCSASSSTRTHIILVSHTNCCPTGKSQSRGSGRLYKKHGKRNANDSHLRMRSGRIK